MLIHELYDKLASQHQEGWKASHWVSKESQEDNFNLLSQIAPFSKNDRILDLGCGQGDLYGFLTKRNLPVTYEGIDLSHKMIQRAWEKYPKARFANVDFLDDKFNFQYDWILASGPFNHKVDQDQYLYLQRCFKKMYSLSNKGFGVVLLSRYDPSQKLDYLFGYDPLQVLQIAFDLTPAVNFNNTALTWGFLVFVYNQSWLSS